MKRHRTNIGWTHIPGFRGATWNPCTGCTKISRGCVNCYAETRANLEKEKGSKKYEKGFEIVLHKELLDQPRRWAKPNAIFVNSMSDLFHEDIPFSFIASVMETIAKSPQHVFFILTKRSKRMLEFFSWYIRIRTVKDSVVDEDGDTIQLRTGKSVALNNLWLGVTVEDQKVANERVVDLLKAPVQHRFVSMEPLLGYVDLGIGYKDEEGDTYFPLDGLIQRADCPELEPFSKLDWVIVGGESGEEARPMHPNWALQAVTVALSFGVDVFYKQSGEWVPRTIKTLEAGIAKETPEHPTIKLCDCGKNASEFHDCETDGQEVWMERVGKNQAGSALEGMHIKKFPAKLVNYVA